MEHLLFILDDTRDLNWDEDEKECKKNKVFLKSIGIKSDIVGWATIDLTVHDAKEKIRLVNEYAGLHHKKMRICYTWREEYKESDWYLLEPESTNVEFEVYRMDKKNGEDEFVGIRAYKVPANIPVVAAYSGSVVKTKI